MLTDDNGIFDFTELPAGRYTVAVSKSGFVSLSYGQRRPLQSGTPLQLVDGQQLKGIDFQLPRGSVIGGHILDEDGDPMPGVMVRVMRYQYQQGDRRLTPAGNGQTDDKGQYRVWGLMPGDYYVNAQARRPQEAAPGSVGGRVAGFRGGPPGGGGGIGRTRRRARRRRRRRSGRRRGSGELRADLLSRRRVDGRREADLARPQRRVARHQLQHAARTHVAAVGPHSESRRHAGDERQRQPDRGHGQRRRTRQSDRHELRRPHPVGRCVHDRQRRAGALHPARARRRCR